MSCLIGNIDLMIKNTSFTLYSIVKTFLGLTTLVYVRWSRLWRFTGVKYRRHDVRPHSHIFSVDNI